MDFLQKFIHQLEVGGGMRYFRLFALLLAAAVVTLLYDAAGFKNMGTQEAMDAAQLARNISQGKGYTTYFIRPLSLSLVKERNLEKKGPPALGEKRDDARLSGNHPDLANPPVYPVVLAGLMKVWNFRYPVDTAGSFWSIPKQRITDEGGRQFWRYQPDFVIAVSNQFLFFAALALVFLLSRRLFDERTAWLSVVLLFGSELFWKFSVSGLSTMLVLLIFTGLLWGLVWLEEELREPKGGRTRLFLLAGGIGALVGVGALTRYSFGWLLLPVLAFLLLFSGRQRLVLASLALGAFLLVFLPWVVRNYEVSGTPFGTAGYALVEITPDPDHQLERSLHPTVNHVVQIVRYKLMSNLRSSVQNDLPRLGGTWVTGFFLAGLLLSLPQPATQRLRYFLLMCLGVLVFVQALGRTQLAEDSPEINSENLLVLLAPLVLVYGVSLFYLLLDQIDFRFRELRLAVVALFAALACLPLLLFLTPVALAMLIHFQPPESERPFSLPYYPPFIQEAGRWSKPDGLIMSDMPWAVAWYGQAQSVWLTQKVGPNLRDLNAGGGQAVSPAEDFSAIHDYEKPIDALFVSQVTLGKLDSRLVTPVFLYGQQSWGNLLFQAVLSFPRDARNSRAWPAPVNLPVYTSLGATSDDLVTLSDKRIASFPLHYMQTGWPEYLLLTASESPVRR